MNSTTSAAPVIRSPTEIEALKRNWTSDPCWDLAATEGFEAHREELQQFSDERAKMLKIRRQGWLQAQSVKLGCPGNLALAEYVDGLETRIKELSDRVQGIEDAGGRH
jgi:hypothetical protein